MSIPKVVISIPLGVISIPWVYFPASERAQQDEAVSASMTVAGQEDPLSLTLLVAKVHL